MGIGLDISVFVGQLVSFLILLGVLTYFGYRPLRRVLDERASRIRASVEQAELTRIEYENVREQAKEELRRAQREAHQVLVDAGQMRERLLSQAESEAREQARVVIEEAREKIRNERESMLEGLRQRFAEAAISVAELIVKESLDVEKHRRLIDQALEERLPLREEDLLE
ncbi:MAG TPA: ATP synthase F0 subunit B [Dehalococcoidia bacterium]|nr:ATP synthase F0 subunit B [Dehalococcoidia bacterium]